MRYGLFPGRRERLQAHLAPEERWLLRFASKCIRQWARFSDVKMTFRFSIREFWFRLIVAAVFLGGTTELLDAQMRPDAPLRNFKLPVFGDNGYKVWELRGVEGRYISDAKSEILGLDLEIFSGDEAMISESRIKSPQAMIFLDERRAEGDSSLFFDGRNFVLRGEKWSWDGKIEHLVVRGRPKVTFYDSIDILK